MKRTSIALTSAVHNKLKKMGFAGQSLGELIDDLCDFAKEKIDDFYEFLDERYPDEEEEEEEEENE